MKKTSLKVAAKKRRGAKRNRRQTESAQKLPEMWRNFAFQKQKDFRVDEAEKFPVRGSACLLGEGVAVEPSDFMTSLVGKFRTDAAFAERLLPLLIVPILAFRRPLASRERAETIGFTVYLDCVFQMTRSPSYQCRTCTYDMLGKNSYRLHLHFVLRPWAPSG